MAPRLNAANQAETTLDAAVASGDTTISVTDASVFPSAPFRATISDETSDEIIEVGNVDTTNNDLESVSRGLEDTSAQSWSSGDSVDQRFTAGTYGELADEYNAADGVNISGDDISVDESYQFTWTGTHEWSGADIGVGTSSPQAPVHINAPSDFGGPDQFVITDTDTSGTYFKIKSATNGTDSYVPNFEGRSSGFDGLGIFYQAFLPSTNDVFNQEQFAALTFDGRSGDTSSFGAIQNTNLVSFRNDGTAQVVIRPDGTLALLTGDLTDGTNTIYDTSNGYVPQTILQNDSLTVAGNTVSLGGSTAINHGDLSSIGAEDHHNQIQVSDSGTAVLTQPTDVNFASNLTVTDDTDGTVTIDATDTNTDTRVDVSEAGALVLAEPTDINFTASGAATVNASDDGDGTVTVDISSTDTNTDTRTDVSDNGTTTVAEVTDINFGTDLAVTDDGDGTVTVDSTVSAPEEVSFASQHTQYADALSSEEIYRLNLQTGETFNLDRIDVRQKGGGTSSNFTVEVYDNGAASVIDSATLGSTSTAGGTSNSGSTVLIRVSNSTGGVIEASITVHGTIT